MISTVISVILTHLIVAGTFYITVLLSDLIEELKEK